MGVRTLNKRARSGLGVAVGLWPVSTVCSLTPQEGINPSGEYVQRKANICSGKNDNRIQIFRPRSRRDKITEYIYTRYKRGLSAANRINLPNKNLSGRRTIFLIQGLCQEIQTIWNSVPK